MSSSFRISPSSSAHLDYSENQDKLDEQTSSTKTTEQQKTYIDRSGRSQEKTKLKRRKTSKRLEKKKQKKLAERVAREASDSTNDNEI